MGFVPDVKFQRTTYDLSTFSSRFAPGVRGRAPKGHIWHTVPDAMQFRCFRCGAAVHVPKGRVAPRARQVATYGDIRAVRFFCALSCANTTNRVENGAGRKVRPPETKLCDFCGVSFIVSGRTKTRRRRTCSRKCTKSLFYRDADPARLAAIYAKTANTRRELEGWNPGGLFRFCWCGTRIDFQIGDGNRWMNRHESNLFCSSSCSSKWGHAGKTAEMEKARHAKSEEGRVRRTGSRFRNDWERNFAEALDRRGLAWTHEPKSFETPHGFYTPDFQVGDLYIDVKGRKNEEQGRRIVHLQNAGEPIVVIMGRGNKQPDYQEAVEAIRNKQMPVGTVFM